MVQVVVVEPSRTPADSNEFKAFLPHTRTTPSDLIVAMKNSKNAKCTAESMTHDTVETQSKEIHHVKHPTSWLETLVHLLRGNIGSGLFAMGEAFMHAGLIVAPVLTLILAVACVHSQHILLKCARMVYRNDVSNSKPPGFAETIEKCFASGPQFARSHSALARKIVNCFLCVTQLGFCCVFFVFIANNIKQVMDEYIPPMDVRVYMVFALPPILFSSWIRNLKFLAPLSAMANVLMVTGLTITLYFCSVNLPSISERQAFGSWAGLPLFFGTAIFCFEGIGLVMPLQNEMKRPKKFATSFGVLNIGMTVVTTLFVVIGFLGYLQYGEQVQGSVTLNLPATSILAQVVKVVVSLALMFTYALQFYVPVEILWPDVRRYFFPQDESLSVFERPSRAIPEIVFRTLLVLITFISAELVPQLGLVISLVGAVSSTALALLFPPLSELLLVRGTDGHVPLLVLVKDVFLIVLGLVGFVTGTYASLQGIAQAFSQEYAAGEGTVSTIQI